MDDQRKEERIEIGSEEEQINEATEQKTIPEYDLNEGIERLIGMIEAKLADSPPVVVALAGGSASGKTSLVAKRLEEHFGEKLSTVSMDNYYFGRDYREQQAAQGHHFNWDQPESMDIDRLRSDIQHLREGEDINTSRYDFATEMPVPNEVEIHHAGIILVEGMFALHDKVASVADIKAFVEVETHGRIMRRLMRDVAERDREPNGIIRYFAEVGVPMHNEHVESTKPNADIIIKNEYLADIEAGKSGVTEATLKFPTDLSEEGIKSVGAAEIRRTHQKDIYFNSGDRDLKNTGEILRIREEGERKIFTYKGPKLDHSGVAQRSRIEFDIDAQTEDALRALYIQSSLIIEKDRTIFKLGNVEFSLDRVEASRNGERIEMGSFIELRNNTGEASDLSELIAKLQLDYENSTTDAYIEIALSNLEH